MLSAVHCGLFAGIAKPLSFSFTCLDESVKSLILPFVVFQPARFDAGLALPLAKRLGCEESIENIGYPECTQHR